ncbi:MAG: hypothetical protein HFG54_11635 [Lachnospiraceae bacterium]|jgi:hypothetical protein|nr:hypothetical protein [Lachnospiraceae bacterium]
MANGLVYLVMRIAMIVISFRTILESCEELKTEIKRARKFYTRRAKAQVVRAEEEVFLGRTYYWPVFCFESEGVEYEKKSKLFTDQITRFEPGFECEIRYNTDNPNEFMVAEDQEIYNQANRIAMKHVAVLAGGSALLILAILMKFGWSRG